MCVCVCVFNRIELYTGNQSSEIYTYKSGIRVVVHHQLVVPFLIEDGFNLSPGFMTNVELYKTAQNHLPSPYSDCRENLDTSTYADKKLFKDYGVQLYTQKFCLKVCYQVNANEINN